MLLSLLDPRPQLPSGTYSWGFCLVVSPRTTLVSLTFSMSAVLTVRGASIPARRAAQSPGELPSMEELCHFSSLTVFPFFWQRWGDSLFESY